jgi:hypothetical protein
MCTEARVKHTLVLLSALLSLLVASCSANESETQRLTAGEQEGVALPAHEATQDSDLSLPSLEQHLIIRQADLQLVVEDTEAAQETVTTLVDELGGYTVTSEWITYDEGVRIDLTVRVPAEELDGVLARLRALALEVRRQIVTGEDVTEDYTDQQAQLRHLEATEARLLTFLDEAEDTEATLAVYSELRQVQREIEQIKGRIQYLEDASAMSSIRIELIPDELAQPISVAGWRPQGTLRNAAQALIRTFQFLVNALIWVVVFILPVALLVFGLPALVLIWSVRRRRRQRG